MKKWMVLAVLVVFLAPTVGMAAGNKADSPGPAPNAGDGISDGSGLDSPNGPSDTATNDTGSGNTGPAPNAGDGVSDGSGLASPSGPNG